ncbi:cation/H+ exchanger [Thelephora ganbajun]|uniref:Cation/H+ exchanger n=1 Tax=Thelephora ganbajun TaxID=370292 RepID=A0ACB6ZQP0_THEGA|nr:cation/H+ exchanger [Thelephora ganbajun]
MGAFADEIIQLGGQLVSRAASEQGGVLSGDNPARYQPTNPMRLWIIQLLVIIGMTQLLAIPLGKIKQPRVIAEVIGGIILGPTVMGRIPHFSKTIFPPESLPLLVLTSNIGITLFLFLVGLEVDVRLMKRNGRSAALISVLGLVVPLGLGAAIAVPLYHTFISHTVNFGYFILFVAVAVGITAFPVLCRILTELKLLDTTVGVVVLAAGVGNDVVGWVLLALTVTLVNASGGLTALYVFLVGIGYVIFMLWPVRWAFRFLLKKSGSLATGQPTTLVMTVTLLMVFVSAFLTDIIGIHPIFGGFVAGLIIPHDNGFAIALVEKFEDLVSILLLPLYFALSGLRTNLGLLNNGITWGYTILLCVVSFLAKFLPCAITAKFCGFNFRESGAIGALMSCKGLVELIVLNIGLQAGVLDTRTFSMFVLHALVLTFITTPLTILVYPSRHRAHIGVSQKENRDLADVEGLPGGSSDDEFKTRFAVVLDKLEQLPAIMTITQLLSNPSSRSVSAFSESSTDEKTSIREVSPFRPVSMDALRLIELTERTSAVMMSAEADYVLQTDPVVSVVRTFGALNHVPVRASISVVNHGEFSNSVARHVDSSSSQMLLVPWKATGNDDTAGPAGFNPFDNLFKRTIATDHSSEVVNSHYIRKLFAETKVDVCLIIDRGLSTSGTPGDQHIFLPFFGGPDDRLALSLVVQLCAGGSGVTATIVRIKKTATTETPESIEEVKTTVHNTVFPDTVYGYQSTQTRLASDTADDLAWGRYTSKIADATLREAVGQIKFNEEHSDKPLHFVQTFISTLRTRSEESRSRRLLVVVGRSRRMATESHTAELKELLSENHTSVGGEASKTLGEVGTAVISGGVGEGVLVVQAKFNA